MQHISSPNIIYQFRSTTITQLLRKCGENWCTASAGAILDFRSFILANIKPPLPGMKKRQNLRWTSVDHSPTMYLENEEKERWYIFAFIRFRVVSCAGVPGWVLTSTSPSCTGRSRAMWCATCSASGAGSIASSPRWFENASFSCYYSAMRICCPAVLTAFSVSAEWVEMMTNRTVHWAQNIKYHWNGFRTYIVYYL